MKFTLVLVVFAVVCSMAFASPENLENLEDSGVVELVRHKRLSCLFENQAISAIACGASCITRKGKRGGWCSNGVCRCTPN
ncbi:defensin-like [Hermetia illucens]|uniref:defensin-like n=1 Tax=Hermetia illucens TaxID=343691 RepID=UPI0018CC0B20|nr:defensin-like [Hermetia illucens]